MLNRWPRKPEDLVYEIFPSLLDIRERLGKEENFNKAQNNKIFTGFISTTDTRDHTDTTTQHKTQDNTHTQKNIT